MTAFDLLEDFRRRGIELRASGDKLRFRPADALSETDRELLRRYKPDLLALLAAESAPPIDTAICPDCNASSTRLGTFALDDGRGRYECSQCGRVFWSLPGQTGAPRSADVSTPRHYAGPTPPCPKCGGPTHDAADHVPGIVVLLCDDGERCRWGLAMSQREFAQYMDTGIVPGQPASEAS